MNSNLEIAYNCTENILEWIEKIFPFVFIYSFAICFILIGIVISLSTPTNDIPFWGLISIGSVFFLTGIYFLFLAIHFTLEYLIRGRK